MKGTNITRISVCWDIIFKCIILYSANQEYNSLLHSQQAETAKFNAMLKKTGVKTSSLELMLEQKVKENQELALNFDELINKCNTKLSRLESWTHLICAPLVMCSKSVTVAVSNFCLHWILCNVI